MSTSEIRLERLTRREFRQALDDGHFQVAILATGSIEQHNEHLALGTADKGRLILDKAVEGVAEVVHDRLGR